MDTTKAKVRLKEVHQLLQIVRAEIKTVAPRLMDLYTAQSRLRREEEAILLRLYPSYKIIHITSEMARTRREQITNEERLQGILKDIDGLSEQEMNELNTYLNVIED